MATINHTGAGHYGTAS